ncbi:dephospho-CoA kinase [Meridianimaribacter flavus]|uniref:Dephospho-CoA kinase n=1 Tax=Meridianimaribacter flavus TaxID=571115 RepID=A0ABY2G7K0_9FLAO|nr:dephospho-CoA kinase [Meridianimaribacter flavus]TDY12621.1 dephospho-CoA kinase [Meridianimaribacter flavus]
MKIVGLTGGIGSGKTTVAKLFSELGVSIYIADVEAKKLMNRSKVIRRKLIALFGEKAYTNEALNRPYIASKIFNNKELLEQMNAIVHPKVGAHFKRWLKKQNGAYVIKEAAIIFEEGMQSQYDCIVLVTADLEERINRVLQRDNTSREKVLAIVNNQLSDEEKIKKSDFVIVNNSIKDTKAQVLKIHKSLIK